MGEVIWGTDFRKHRDEEPETLEQMAARIWDNIKIPQINDTAPSEMNPDSGDCA